MKASERRLKAVYSAVSFYLRDRLEYANTIEDIIEVLSLIESNYNIGNLQPLDYKWLIEVADKRKTELKSC